MSIRKMVITQVVGMIVASTLFGQFPGAKPWVIHVYNAASYAEPESPNGALAPGSMFVVKGMGLGPSGLQMMEGFPLNTRLADTSIRVKVGRRSWSALMIYSSSWQCAAILPSDVSIGKGTVTVTFNSETSNPEPIRIVESSFGVFTRNEAGAGPAIAQNYLSETDLRLNALTQVARPGQVMILWGTGLGAASGDEAIGPVPGDLAVPLDVMVGGKAAKVLYKGRSGCCAGIDQIVFEVPESVEGCYVPIVVHAGEVLSNFTTIAVASSGEVCSDLPGLNAPALAKLQRGESVTLGRVELARIVQRVEMAGVKVELKTDYGLVDFSRYRPSQLLASQSVPSYLTGGMPSPGYCSILRRNDLDVEMPLPAIFDDVHYGVSMDDRLDAGDDLILTGPLGSKPFWKTNERYGGFLGGVWADPWTSLPEYLQPGTYTVRNGEGGQEVGPFEATLELPQPVVWTNRDNLAEVRRTQDLTLTWSSPAAEEQIVLIYATSVGINQEHWPMGLLCAEWATVGQYTVPSWLLSQLPASDSIDGVPTAYLGVITIPAATARAQFTASGVDDGRSVYTLAEFQLIPFR